MVIVNLKYAVILIVSLYFSPVVSSQGDRSPYYSDCLGRCVNKNCTGQEDAFRPEAALLQDPWARLLMWNCRDECKYHCMLRTVKAYEQRNYEVPKFHGKWPFVRIFGMQEPASVLTSAMNLATHTYMYRQLVKDDRFSIRTMPVLIFWHFFYAVCAHGWVWSILYHSRETPLTEFMDYSCALSIVMVHFAAAVVRLFHYKRTVGAVILLGSFVFYVNHVYDLYDNDIAYDYHMTVNIICGMLGTALWLLYALGAMCAGVARERQSRRYVWRLVVFCKLTGLAVLLELFDFPPYARVWDAHALWHLATSPLPLLFYRFVIDDLDYLRTSMYRELEKKTDDKHL